MTMFLMPGLRLVLLALSAVVVAASGVASAAELVMVRRDSCPWCRAWDRDVGRIYSKTDIGRRLPLRMVTIRAAQPPIDLKSPIIYTPTFVLVEQGRELGRIEGYPGEVFFWGLLERLAQSVPLWDASGSSQQSGEGRSDGEPGQSD